MRFLHSCNDWVDEYQTYLNLVYSIDIILSPLHVFLSFCSHNACCKQLNNLGKPILDEDIIHEDLAKKVWISFLCILLRKHLNFLLNSSLPRKHRLDNALKASNIWRGSNSCKTRLFFKMFEKSYRVLTNYFLVFFNQLQSSYFFKFVKCSSYSNIMSFSLLKFYLNSLSEIINRRRNQGFECFSSLVNVRLAYFLS